MSDVDQKPDLPALHRLAYSQDGLFTTRQAQERGVSAQLLPTTPDQAATLLDPILAGTTTTSRWNSTQKRWTTS